jgi:hypothetical protein
MEKGNANYIHLNRQTFSIVPFPSLSLIGNGGSESFAQCLAALLLRQMLLGLRCHNNPAGHREAIESDAGADSTSSFAKQSGTRHERRLKKKAIRVETSDEKTKSDDRMKMKDWISIVSLAALTFSFDLHIGISLVKLTISSC